MDKSVPRVTVWHHSAEQTITLGTLLFIGTSLMSDFYILIPVDHIIILLIVLG